MTLAQMRKLAFSFPCAEEHAHMEHPDSRVGGKIFPTLMPAKGQASFKLTPDQQDTMIAARPRAFSPAAGAWGLKGWTRLDLARADRASASMAIEFAWRNVAPKQLVEELDAEE